MTSQEIDSTSVVARAAQSRARSRSRAAGAVVRTLSILTLSAALPSLLVAGTPDVGRSEAWIVTLGIMVWAGLRLSLLWTRGTPRLFDFFFWLFVYIFLGIAPTVQIRSGQISTTTPGMDPGLDLPAAGIVALGLACYEVGWLLMLARERRVARRREPTVRAVSTWRTWALVTVALLLSAYVLSRLGATVFLGSREAAGAAREAAWPDPATRSIIFASGVYPLLVGVGALVQLRRAEATDAVVRRWAGIAAVCGAVALLLIVNPVASARYSFGTVAFALVVFAGALLTPRRTRLTMLATIAGFLFVFPLADAFRRPETAGVSRVDFFSEYPANPDYDAFWQIANSFSYWLDGLVQPFSQFLGSILFWIPRSIWPDKPTDTGIVLAQYRGYAVDNLSAPLWAEAVVNGGVLAVAIAFVVLGAALRAMDTRVAPAIAAGGVWGIVGAILPVYMTILLRGSLLQATGALMLTIACVLLVREPAAPVGRAREGSAQAGPTRAATP